MERWAGGGGCIGWGPVGGSSFIITEEELLRDNHSSGSELLERDLRRRVATWLFLRMLNSLCSVGVPVRFYSLMPRASVVAAANKRMLV